MSPLCIYSILPLGISIVPCGQLCSIFFKFSVIDCDIDLRSISFFLG